MEFMGWDVRCHPIFTEIITSLYHSVYEIKQNDPLEYRTHKNTRLLARIYKIITEEIPSDPTHHRYFQGNTLGTSYRDWKRAKFGRYRLFFKYSSKQHLIIDAWINDDDTLRKAGSETDPYRVFKRMLDRKEIQDNFSQLEIACVCPWTETAYQIPAQFL